MFQKSNCQTQEKGYRRLVLETQSCNFPAISFYLKFGFDFLRF
ncbi:MAG: GNAT family N-acetyltransferase [Kosmotogaceae bacterium]